MEWISRKAIVLSKNEKAQYEVDGDILAWVRILDSNAGEGRIGIEHIGSKYNGLLQEVNVERIKEQIRYKMKQSNTTFELCDDNVFNPLFLTCDSHILISMETIQQVLYGTEEIIAYSEATHALQHLRDDGIWSKKVFTKLDILFFFKPNVDLLGDDFDPYVFVNPFKKSKLKNAPRPFSCMKTHVPSLYFRPRELDLR